MLNKTFRLYSDTKRDKSNYIDLSMKLLIDKIRSI